MSELQFDHDSENHNAIMRIMNSEFQFDHNSEKKMSELQFQIPTSARLRMSAMPRFFGPSPMSSFFFVHGRHLATG